MNATKITSHDEHFASNAKYTPLNIRVREIHHILLQLIRIFLTAVVMHGFHP